MSEVPLTRFETTADVFLGRSWIVHASAGLTLMLPAALLMVALPASLLEEPTDASTAAVRLGMMLFVALGILLVGAALVLGAFFHRRGLENAVVAPLRLRYRMTVVGWLLPMWDITLVLALTGIVEGVDVLRVGMIIFFVLLAVLATRSSWERWRRVAGPA